ncbi:MAG: DNA polymerase III subunit chi [Gammaproteobacteria bacterium]
MSNEATRIDFYVLDDSSAEARLRFACRLAEKAVHLNNRVIALAADESVARHLDELLWTFRAESFVPHAVAEDAAAEALPVMISFGADAPQAQGDLLINLTPAVPACYESFARVAEIIDSSDECRQQGRTRFSFYRNNGLEPQTHKIT